MRWQEVGDGTKGILYTELCRLLRRAVHPKKMPRELPAKRSRWMATGRRFDVLSSPSLHLS